MNKCPVCNTLDVEETPYPNLNLTRYTCSQCGDYCAIDNPRIADEKLRPIVSHYIRKNQNNKKPVELKQSVIDSISKGPFPTIDEKIVTLMNWIKTNTKYPGEPIKGMLQKPELVAICAAENHKEVGYFVNHLKERNFIKSDSTNQNYTFSVDGFKYLDENINKINNNLCFCAMSFDSEHNFIYSDILKPAVQKAGYEILRIDQHLHNEGIMDQVHAKIRDCKFLISDLTGHKHGVYYEAGFAKGLGKEVFYTCEDTDFDRIHFDIKHIITLKWTRGEKEKAINNLQYRIEGTLGRGTL